jgi:hypothetical protein
MSFLVDRLKAVNAPKTEDAGYDEACAAFQRHGVRACDFQRRVAKLEKALRQLSGACVRFSGDLGALVSARGEAAHSGAVVAAALQLGQYSDLLDSQAAAFLPARLPPHFLEPLAAYERSVADASKLRAQRARAVADFDRERELLRLAEASRRTGSSSTVAPIRFPTSRQKNAR